MKDLDSYIVSLAGIPIGITSVYPTTKDYLREYICEAVPRFCVAVTEADILREREISNLRDERRGLEPHPYSDSYLETVAVLRKIAPQLPGYGAVLFHGAVVAVDGEAYMFIAPSGTGKTTHIRLWLELLPQAYILNGDKPFLRDTDQGVTVSGTPWRGKEKYGRNETLPLKAICLLERDSTNHIETVSLREALPALFRQAYRTEEHLSATLELIGKIGTKVTLCRLGCTTDAEAAAVSIRHMAGFNV